MSASINMSRCAEFKHWDLEEWGMVQGVDSDAIG